MRSQSFKLFLFCGLLASCAQGNLRRHISSESRARIQLFESHHDGALQETPDLALGDEIVVKISELEPLTKYHLRFETNIGKRLYRSEFHVVSSEKGQTQSSPGPDVSVFSESPEDLFWSMVDSGEVPEAPRTFRVTVLNGDEVSAVRTFPFVGRRGTVDEVATPLKTPHKFFVPKSGVTPGLPVIISFSGSEGGLKAGEEESVYFAHRGYPALGLAYFNAPGVNKDLLRVDLELFRQAIGFLRSHPQFQHSPIVLNGVSRGGELALLLGSLLPEVSGVIARVPSSVVWQGMTQKTFTTDELEPELPPFIVDGGEVPYVNWTGKYADHKMSDGSVAKIRTPWFLDSREKNKTAYQRAAIPVEKIRGPLLLLGGRDDLLWPSCLFMQEIEERLKSSNYAYPVISSCAENAGHGAVRLPLGPPTTVEISVHAVTKARLFLGGTPEGNGRGQRKFRQLMINFLKTNFRP